MLSQMYAYYIDMERKKKSNKEENGQNLFGAAYSIYKNVSFYKIEPLFCPVLHYRYYVL